MTTETKLILTEEEQKILEQASKILGDVYDTMKRESYWTLHAKGNDWDWDSVDFAAMLLRDLAEDNNPAIE